MGSLTAKTVATAMLAFSALCCGATDSVEVIVGGETQTLTITVVDRNSVVVSTLSLQVGDSAMLAATAQNSLGLPLGNITPTWDSTNPSVASVSATGVVHALSAGTTNITASYAGVTATVPTTVSNPAGPPPPPPQGSWPHNEPPNMTYVFDTNGSDKMLGSFQGRFFFGARWLDNNFVTVMADPGSRYGNAIEKRMFVGDPSAWNGVALWDDWGPNYRELYIRWIVKYSSNYDVHSAGEKHFYWGAADGAPASDYYIVMKPNRAIGITNQAANGGFTETVSNYIMPLNQYVTFELHVVAESAAGAGNGSYRLWANGTQILSSNTVRWITSGTVGFNGFQFFGYWGGAGDTKTANDWIRISEFYISAR